MCKPGSWHPKPKSKDLTLQPRLLLLFVQHNILPQGGHRSEPSYIDLWLMDSILCVRKVNLGFLIVQHMGNVLSSTTSVLPYGMLLITIFNHLIFISMVSLISESASHLTPLIMALFLVLDMSSKGTSGF